MQQSLPRTKEISMEEKKKRRDLALRFGKSMIRKTFKPNKKSSESSSLDRMKKLGIVCEDDIVVSSNNSSSCRKRKKIVEKSLFESSSSSSDDEENVIEDTVIEDNVQKKKRKVSSPNSDDSNESQPRVKIPKNSKYYTSLGIETDESSRLELEFIGMNLGSYSRKKALEIKDLVDSSLNYDESDEEFSTKPYKLYICLERESRLVVGCLIAEKISSARRVHFKRKHNERSSSSDDDSLFESFKQTLSQSVNMDELHSPKLVEHPSLDLSDINFNDSSNAKEKAVCGISRIWVSEEYRRRGIGTMLLDYTRKNLSYAYQVPRKYIALTPFTPTGFKFIVGYLSKGKDRVDSVLVY